LAHVSGAAFGPGLILCSSRKYPYSPQRRDWDFWEEGGGRFCKTKKFKEMYEA